MKATADKSRCLLASVVKRIEWSALFIQDKVVLVFLLPNCIQNGNVSPGLYTVFSTLWGALNCAVSETKGSEISSSVSQTLLIAFTAQCSLVHRGGYIP